MKLVATLTLRDTGQRMTAELKQIEQKRVAEFRPSKGFKWDYGFDWFRESRDGDGGINFKEKGLYLPVSLDYLEKEYDARKINYIDWSERIKGKDNRYCSWLSLYPPDAGYGTSVAKLRLLIYDGDKSRRPLKLEYDKDCFRIMPDVFPPDKKSTKGHIYKEEITIECLKALEEKKAIRVLTDDYRDEEVGCLYVMPNDASHRYKLKTRLVKVYLLPEDIDILENTIKSTTIEELLSGGALSHCFVRPVVESDVRELDLTHRSAEWESYMKKIPSEDGKGMETVIEKEYLDEVSKKIISAYYNPPTDTDKKELPSNTDKKGYFNIDTDGDDRLVMYFINYRCEDTRNGGKVFGYSSTPGLSSLIMSDGVNSLTLNHEVLHTLGLLHTSDITNIHRFKEGHTDNIMEGFESDDDMVDSRQRSTYKWQWDIVWTTTKSRQIPNDD